MSGTTRIGGEVFDSRDVTERLEELCDSCETDGEREEFAALTKLAEWGEENVSDWPYGETLIREDYFTEYAQELAADVGVFLVLKSDGFNYSNPHDTRDIRDTWPFGHIDWEAAADELKADYVTVDFQGSTYYVRSV